MLKPLIAASLLATTALPAAAFDISEMTAAEREAFGAAVREYILENPGVIREAVVALEAQEQLAQVEMEKRMVAVNAAALNDDGFSWVGGNPDGDVTIVEFLDYRCGYCRRAHPEVAELLNSDGNIRLVVKELPILGPDSEASSRFAIATKQVHGDDAYKAVSDALIELNSAANEASLRRVAEGLDLDADPVIAQMDSDAVTEVIEETRALAQRLQINGTPTFVMGDEMVRGYVPLEGMRQIIANERADG